MSKIWWNGSIVLNSSDDLPVEAARLPLNHQAPSIM